MDVLIRDLTEVEVAALDREAKRRGMTRAAFLRQTVRSVIRPPGARSELYANLLAHTQQPGFAAERALSRQAHLARPRHPQPSLDDDIQPPEHLR